MNLKEITYIPGKSVTRALALERFFPPLSAGVIQSWLQTNVPEGAWIIDPFGSHPYVPIEAARNGYKILTTCNNPIVRLIIEIMASPPSKKEYLSAISELLTTRRGNERLEIFLQAMYETRCSSCGRSIQAEAFLWRKDESIPYGKIIQCPFCNYSGEQDIQEEDIQLIQNISREPLSRHRAAQMVASPGEETYENTTEALRVYNSRQLYFIMTLLNKSESLVLDKRKELLIQGMLLHLFDKGNILWNWPVSRTRPKSLVSPSQFKEDNLWLEIEKSLKVWVSEESIIPLTLWPNLPEGNGICVFPGRFRDFPGMPDGHPIKNAVSVIPRPNQVFWTFSAIWSGWLWGREAVNPLKGALDRKRYDWKWHTNALHSHTSCLVELFSGNFTHFCIIPELVPRFLASVIGSNSHAGFINDGISFRDEDNTAQIVWKISGRRNDQGSSNLERECLKSNASIFNKTNEPLTYSQLHAHFFGLISQAGYFNQNNQPPGDLIDNAEDCFEKVISSQELYKRFGTESQNLELGFFWNPDEESTRQKPLADQVEELVIEYLEENLSTDIHTLDKWVCNKAVGIITPPFQLINTCLLSYGKDVNENGRYTLADKERNQNRQEDIKNILNLLRQTGEKLGFQVDGSQPIQWKINSSVNYKFFLTNRANLSEFLSKPFPGKSSQTRVIIIPGSRSSIVNLKLKNDGRLANLCREWKLIKFRHIRRLLQWDNLTPELFNGLLDKDPMLWEEESQLSVFDLQPGTLLD